MRKCLLLYGLSAFLLLLSQPALAQLHLSGKVTDSSSGEPLSYVNIGIKNKNTGTLSGQDGTFLLAIPQWLLIEDSLTFSAPGYTEKSFFIPALARAEEITVKLQLSPLPAETAKESQEQWKEKIIGAKSSPPLLHGMASSRTGDILEIAQPVKVKKKPLRLLEARLYLNSISPDSCSVRVKLYTNEEGKPGTLLVAENILLERAAQKGWFVAELEAYKLVMKDNFFISFEFLPRQRQVATNLVYGGQLGRGRGYARSSSLGEWEEVPCSFAVQALVKVEK